MLIDTHTHILDEKLDEQRQDILNSFAECNLFAINEVGFDFESSKNAFELSQKHEKVFCSVGVHPHEAKTCEQEHLQYFKSVATNDKVLAIGEVGLDYFYNLSPRECQIEVFEKHILLANEVNLPLILHIRDAYEDCFNVLKSNKDKLNNGILLHCYSGSKEMAKRFLNYNCYFGFGGAITFKNAKKEEVILSIPQSNLLIETDCPYMAPMPFRGKTNKPDYVSFVGKKMAEILNLSYDEVCNLTTANAKSFFKKLK